MMSLRHVGLNKKRSGKPKNNRGKMLHQASKGSHDMFDRLPAPGLGKANGGNCENCKSPDHWRRNCPNLLPKPHLGEKGFKNKVKKSGPKGEKPSTANVVEDPEGDETTETEPIEGESKETPEVYQSRDGAWNDDYCEEENWSSAFMLSEHPLESWAFELDAKYSGMLEEESMGMIDSGAASTVCGSKWLQRWLRDAHLPKMREWGGGGKYRFGEGRATSSVGNVVLDCPIKAMDGSATALRVECDVAEGNVAVLISYQSLRRMNSSIDFVLNQIRIAGKLVQLEHQMDGRIFNRFIKVETGLCDDEEGKAGQQQNLKISQSSSHALTSELISVSNQAAATILTEKESLAGEQIIKLHIHLGHASADQLWRTLKNEGRALDLKKIKVIRDKCRCDKNKFALQRPLIHPNGPPGAEK